MLSSRCVHVYISVLVVTAALISLSVLRHVKSHPSFHRMTELIKGHFLVAMSEIKSD